MDPLDILLPYQKRVLEDKTPLRIIEKGRRTGISWLLSLEGALDGLAARGTNTYYISYNHDMTKQFIDDAKYWARALQIVADYFEEEVVDENNKTFKVYALIFPSGHGVYALPSTEYAIRSKQGNIVFDEAAFTDGFEGILKAALALQIWGGKLTIVSTHNGDDSPFNMLLNRIRAGEEPDWSHHRITFSQALEQGLYKKICQTQNREWTAEGEKEFVERVRRIYRDNMEEELDCIPARTGSRYFPRIILDPCADSDIEVIRKGFEDAFLKEPKEKRERVVEKWFNREVLSFIRTLENPVFIGEDFARSGDLTVFWLDELVEKKHARTVAVVELRNWPFDQQWQFWVLLVGALRIFGGAALDARGNGQMIAEKAETEWPGRAIPVMITRAWYGTWFPKLKGRLEDREWTIPQDEYLIGDFGVVRLKAGYPLIDDSTKEKAGSALSRKRHGDGAVASALALNAIEACADDTHPFAEVTQSGNDTIWQGY
ncbi:MAG: terminase family protein [Treponema sp.]|jgi:phage FluMu gp28-like protein|nr:terminase family protein [Treponema sp.]